MGTLRITGTLDPKQFFPTGESDGDTAHLTVKEFAFSENGADNFVVTKAFDGAYVVGRGKSAVIDSKNRITIRFQGIDTPELHFRPTFNKLTAGARQRVKAVNKEFRQFFGETAGEALGKQLSKLNHGAAVPCEVLTAVEAPNDVCDTYGRVVADIIAAPDNKQINLNQWLVENGWAFPAFYNSMSRSEIAILCDLARKAQENELGIWPYFGSTVVFPEADQAYQKGVQHAPDKGRVIFPKYFRRSCTWYVSVEAELMDSVGFKEFLAAQKTPDQCYLTEEFLHNGAASSYLHHLTDFCREDGRVTQPPEGLVFKEDKSTLYDTDGARIEGW